MSDSNAENMNSEQEPRGTESSAESKPGLVNLTHKLKAEALRRLKLDEEQELQDGDSDSGVPVADSVRIRAEAEVLKPQPLEVEQGETKQRNSHRNDDNGSIQEDVAGTERETNIKNSDRLNEEIATLDNSENQGRPSSQPQAIAEESATTSGKENLFVERRIGEYTAPDATSESYIGTGNSGIAKSDDVYSDGIIDDKPCQGIADDVQETLNESETSSGNLNSPENGQVGLKVPLNNTDNSLSASADFNNIPLHVKDQLRAEDGELSGEVKPVIPILLHDEVSKPDNGQMSSVLGNQDEDIDNTSVESSEKHSKFSGLQTTNSVTQNPNEAKATSVSSEEIKTMQNLTDEENVASIAAPDPNMDALTGSEILNTNEQKENNQSKVMSEKELDSSQPHTIEDMSNNMQESEEINRDQQISDQKDTEGINNDISTAEPEESEIKSDERRKDDKNGDGENLVAGESVIHEETDNNVTDLSQPDEEINEDDHTTLPDDFYYERPSLLFNPLLTEGVPHNLLSLHHSFGYECTKRENFHILDTNTVIFSAGNLVQILNLQSMEQSYIGGTNTGGIGAITVHPSRQYFAVAEKGVKPNINIYEYPSLKLFRVLREGTLEAYAHLNFSPTGTKLASLGSSPDFMLTVWDWRNEKVILRSKAFSQDVYKVAFSPENEGHLCTSGSGHIRFWTMANTFTGLKLQGELGRFGTTELTDIEGFVELPDGKVLSGSEWGNMLLWEGGLIKVEICKKEKKLCHNGMIEQFFMDEGELMTIGADGYIKVWDFEGIDNADITDETNHTFEMEPMYEIKVLWI